MDTPIISGKKRSKLYFNKIDIYADRMEAKAGILPKKVIKLDDITSWIEINKSLNGGVLKWIEVTIFTAKTKYMINSLHWNNFDEMREALTAGKTRDLEKEKKIYNSFW